MPKICTSFCSLRYQYEIYSQSWQLTRRLLESSSGPDDDSAYTEIVCNQEGGFAATVLGLMSSNKLQFRYMTIVLHL